ncbi:MAG: sigma-70 family RNA polymerase sigma factor [Firmicutes bacterium]|nr:sigma-70 family RNA polymerase sigma factor [Bacillota bacterium]
MSENHVTTQALTLSQPLDRDGLLMLRSQLVRYCECLSGSTHDAQDLVQATLLKALPALQGEQVHPNLPALLRKVAKNTWLDQVRRLSNHRHSDLDEWVGVIAVDSLDHSSMEEALQVLVQTLTAQQRAVVLLCDVFAYTDREAAQLLGLSPGAVKAALHRARSRLHQARDGTEVLDALDESQKEILDAYVSVFQSADIRMLVQLCRDGSLDPVQATSKVFTWAQRQMGTNKATDYTLTSLSGAA